MGSEPTNSGQGKNTNGHEELAPSFYYHSSPDPLPYGWEPYGVYTRVDDEEVLGTSSLISPSGVKEGLEDRSRCFNCGESDHKVTECRFRLNRDLVALARQYYQFYQKDPVGGWKRIHSVEEWRQKRLDWLEEFEPGKIKGELLKEALCAEYANEDEWMRNISVWGYPRGWVSERDPLELVRARIWSEHEGDIEDHNDDDAPFEIHGDKNDVEIVSFKDVFPLVLSAQNTRTPSTNGSYSDCQPANPSSRSISVTVDPIRWAHYPPSYFSSQHLILYNPPIPSESWSSTVFENTDAYLHQFYRQPNPPPPPNEPPPPLPPSHPPPPLPPSSPPLPLPPPPAYPYLPSLPSQLASEYRKSTNSLTIAGNLDPSDDLSETDMDFSDSD